MLYISKQGHIDASRVTVRIFPLIEHDAMDVVRGIVVHQTGAPTIESTFSSYKEPSAHGAHFLVDLDGKIYQTASLRRTTYHVGKMKSRCIEKRTCSAVELKNVLQLQRQSSTALHRHEAAKAWPERFPNNKDSIGIELVGYYSGEHGKEVYNPVTDAQMASLKWLIRELEETLSVSHQEIFRHPEIARKNTSEASSAEW